jgi:RNA polymerase sigma factor (sigma-70 family)
MKIEELYSNYDYFFKYLKKWSNLDDVIIEDIISECIVLFYEKYYKKWNKELSDLKTYFINLCRLKVFEYLRKEKPIEFEDIEIEDIKESLFNMVTLNQIIDRLDEEKRSWFNLLIENNNGLKIKDISVKWNINENTIKTRIKNIRTIIIEEYSKIEGIKTIPFEKKATKIKEKRYNKKRDQLKKVK